MLKPDRKDIIATSEVFTAIRAASDLADRLKDAVSHGTLCITNEFDKEGVNKATERLFEEAHRQFTDLAEAMGYRLIEAETPRIAAE